MGKKSKKRHHNEVFKFTLPEAPVICDNELANYIANVNTMFEFFPERHGKIIKCLNINWELMDVPHKDKLRLLYSYAFCYFSRTKQTSTEPVSEELKEHLTSEIKKLGEELCHYSKILIIYEMTKPEKRVSWFREILKTLFYDYTINKESIYNNYTSRLMLSLSYALSSPNVNMAYCSHMNEFISKLISSSETSDDIRLMIVISDEVPKRAENTMNDLISIPYRDKEIDGLYNDILKKDFSKFSFVLELIKKLKYIPRKSLFDKMISELKYQKDQNWENTCLYLNRIMFTFHP